MMALLNLAAFNAVWFALVLSAAAGHAWWGATLAAASAAYWLSRARSPRQAAWLFAAAALLGLAAEALLHRAAVTGYPPQAWTNGPAPVWMVALWVNFATTLHDGCLAWLRGRYVAAALAGAAAGPLSYWGGERLGAITLNPEPALWIAAIGLLWTVATPLLVHLAEVTA